MNKYKANFNNLYQEEEVKEFEEADYEQEQKLMSLIYELDELHV